jgi:uncharacterized protein (TIGR00106 family)
MLDLGANPLPQDVILIPTFLSYNPNREPRLNYMLAEFSVVPIGKNVSLSRYVAKSLDIIDKSGLSYRINPMGTVVEGSWEEVMGLIKKCHDTLLEDSERLLTSIKIDDRKGMTNALDRKVKSVEEKVGRELKK